MTRPEPRPRTVNVKCSVCGFEREANISFVYRKLRGRPYICKSCRVKSNKEAIAAALATEKRRKEIAQKKR